MKDLKLISLTERELLNIKGGDSGGGNISCSCDCGDSDQTSNQARSTRSSGALAYGSNQT